jgi:hypothetical protein
MAGQKIWNTRCSIYLARAAALGGYRMPKGVAEFCKTRECTLDTKLRTAAAVIAGLAARSRAARPALTHQGR